MVVVRLENTFVALKSSYKGVKLMDPSFPHQSMRRIFSIKPIPKERQRSCVSEHIKVIDVVHEPYIRTHSYDPKKYETIDAQKNCNASKSESDFYVNNLKTPTPRIHESSHGSEKMETGTDSGTDPETAPSLMLRKETCNELRKLEYSQKQLEISMYQLLNLTKDLRKHELEHGPTPDIDKRRRVEITKILQTLRLQKKNGEKQNELLRTEISCITKNLLEIQKRSKRISDENINLKAKFIETGLNVQNCKGIQDINSCNVHHDSDDTIKMQRLRDEIRKCMSDNEFLKEYVRKLSHDLKEKSAQTEQEREVSTQLRRQIEKNRSADASSTRQLMSSDQSNTVESVSLGNDIIQMKHAHLIREYERLKRLYLFENEQRKTLANELQELQGNIRVMCRFRQSESPCQFTFLSTNKFIPQDPNILPSYRNEEGNLSFNRVFPPNATQSNVFDEIKPLISSCIDGYNVCLMAYGPTGSGKTFTMQGVRGNPGMTVLAVHELCDMCENLRGPWIVKTSVSMMEVYNEVIYDLLSRDMQPVKLCDDGVDVKVNDIEIKPALTKPEFLYWIGKGHARRRIASTKLNIGSSRSHLVIQIHVEMTNNSDSKKRFSKLVLCDLAGSESVEKIEATGNRAVETGFINKSLATLGRVFENLRTHAMLVPYRDSKLTHLLKPCLSGQAKCVLIISVSGDESVLDRNVKAMEFGIKALKVSVGKIKKNTKPTTLPRTSLHGPTNSSGDRGTLQQRI